MRRTARWGQPNKDSPARRAFPEEQLGSTKESGEHPSFRQYLSDNGKDACLHRLDHEFSTRTAPNKAEGRYTDSGIPLQPFYTPDDVVDHTYTTALGRPGAPPYTRGPYPSMYRGRPWTIRQYAGYGTAEESNKRYHDLLQTGVTGLSVAFDLPSQMGYDSDHPLADGEVGKVGVAIDSLADFERLFARISLDQVTTSMTINAPASIMLAMYAALARRQGLPVAALRGTVQNDILKEYLARGTYIFPPEPSMRLTVDLMEYCSQEIPYWNTISISGYHIREAGATAVQEVAFTLANAIAYVEAAVARGLDVNIFGPRLSFFFNAHLHLFEEIAKFRAARRLWATVMKERFGASNPKACMLRFHTQTAGCTLTAQQPELNIVRVALQALAAVLGGTQSLHTNAFDEALSLPSDEAARIALRTQHILAHEFGLTDVIDPVGGSWYLERLTNEIEARAHDYLMRIDEMGGALAAIRTGFMRREIEEAAYRHQRDIDEGKKIIVGVNRFQEPPADSHSTLQVNPTLQERQVESLRTLRARRNHQNWKDALSHLKKTAASSENIMPSLTAAVEAHATVGEICQTLRECWGEYREAG